MYIHICEYICTYTYVSTYTHKRNYIIHVYVYNPYNIKNNTQYTLILFYYMHTSSHTYIHTYIYVYCIYENMYYAYIVQMCICTHICVCTYVLTYVYVHMYSHMCMYICTLTHTRAQTSHRPCCSPLTKLDAWRSAVDTKIDIPEHAQHAKYAADHVCETRQQLAIRHHIKRTKQMLFLVWPPLF